VKAIPTSAIKALTTVFLVLGFGLMLSGPWIVRRPPTMTRKAYAQRAALYVEGLLVAIIGSGAGAYILVRRAKAEYREQSLQNMQSMLEATRADQLKAHADSVTPGRSLFGEPSEMPPESGNTHDR